MNELQLNVSAVDDILSPFGRIIGRVIGRTSNCGLDCDVSELGIAEYLILFVVFVLVFVVARKIKTLIAEKRASSNT